MMKLRLASAAFVGLFFFGIWSIGCDKDDKPDCGGHEVGDEWPDEDGCNTCTCSDQGIECTLVECPKTCPDGHEVGASWPDEDGCNTCTCMGDLTVACTAKACVDLCEGGHLPGETWDAEDGCNTCTCTDGLQISCTEMACVEACDDGHLPGDTWEAEDGCNTCTCMEDLTIACTEMACVEACEDGHLPGDTWEAEDGCNACTCTEDLQIACTAMVCPTCEGGYLPGESWPAGDGCNTCTCMEDFTVACTKMFCPPSCATIEADYAMMVESASSCSKDADCQVLVGQCWTGLGGCWEYVNQTLSQPDLDGLGQKYQDAGCAGAVCKCAPAAAAACIDGICGPAPQGPGKWIRVEGKFTKEGGFFYQFTGYQLAKDLVTVYSAPDKVKCEVPVTQEDTAPLLPAAEAVDWPSVLPSYKSPDNPFCCCDQFVYALDVVLTAADGSLTKISTDWCDESYFGGTMPKPLLAFVESFLGVCGTAAAQCK